MSDPRIVTPQEEQPVGAWDAVTIAEQHKRHRDGHLHRCELRSGTPGERPCETYNLAHTVAAEPDRTRAAVVKALRHYGDAKAYRIAAEIENGAPFDA